MNKGEKNMRKFRPYKLLILLAILLSPVHADVLSSDITNLRNPYLAVPAGQASTLTGVNKYGRNIEIDSAVTADIWDGGKTVASGGVSLIWVAPTAARIHQLVSTSASDAAAGVGARTIQIYGLTSWTTAETSEVITMNGTTDVPTVNAYVIIHRMKVLTKGATSSNVGVITATADTDSTVTALISALRGQTLMAIYGISSVETAYMGAVYATANKSGGAAALVDVTLLVNPEPDAELTNYLEKQTFGLSTAGTSAWILPYYTPKKITGPAIIKIQATSGTNDMDVSAGFDIIKVTE